jgi:carbonic anhydrase/acetyltransferase-like protein (isoleucine patch superfamily)
VNGLIVYQGKTPKIHSSVFIAEGARIVGDVEIGEQSSVWFNSVVRGDVHYIRIGARTNIQDNVVLHVTHGRFPLVIGSDVTVGHGAILHGCRIDDCCLIGMGAIVLDNAKISSRSMIAAGSLVREGFEVPEGVLAAGVPATVKRPLSETEKTMIVQSATNYVQYVETYRG